MTDGRKITININDVSPLTNTAYVDVGKENIVYNKSQINELVEDLKEGTVGSISPSQTLEELNVLSDGNYYAAEAGTYAFSVTVPVGWQYRFSKIGNVWNVLTKVEMPMQDLSTVVAKSSLKSSDTIDYSAYIVNGFTYNGSGVKTSSPSSKIIEDLPIKTTESYITIKNIIADSLKKVFFKNNEGVIVGAILDLAVIPKVLNRPNGATKLCLCFSRSNQTEMPIIEYGNNTSANIYEIENKKLTAQSLTLDNDIPNPTAPKMAVNKEYFDTKSANDGNIVTETIYSDNKLNRDYIVIGKYINSSGEVLSSSSQHIIQNHPISEYAGRKAILGGYVPTSIKKLVFRDNNNLIVGSIISLTTEPFSFVIPELAVKYDLSIKSSTDSVSSYDELRMNLGDVLFPYEPFKTELITSVMGKKIYAEKAKGAESGGGNSFDQSLNKADDVMFKSVTTSQLIYSAIQFNLPTGNGTSPSEVQIGDAWVDTTNNTIKVKLS